MRKKGEEFGGWGSRYFTSHPWGVEGRGDVNQMG